MATHTKFKAKIYVLTAAEGGRTNPFFNGYRPKFSFTDKSVTGGITLPENTELAQPGDSLEVIAELIEAVSMESGTSFEVFEPGHREFVDNEWVQISGNKTVILGDVLEVLK